MNLTLTRTDKRDDGIFGSLVSENGDLIAVTLEHAYDSGLGNGGYAPKLPIGTYNCRRSMHRLHGMANDFETFEVMSVPGHKGILFHWGNYNADSDGCILVGKYVANLNPSTKMISLSKSTFAAFMELQKDVNEFTLTVKDE